MARRVRSLVGSLAKALGYALVPNALARKLLSGKDPRQTLDLMACLPDEAVDRLLPLLPQSRAQLSQDLFALAMTGFRQGGYFVEFGATNGLDLSNTHLLEKAFGWNGILAEPARGWHEALRRNRSCHIETDCVWKTTGDMLDFREADAGELSTISAYSHRDRHDRRREAGTGYQVRTVSLADLLDRHGAPADIDFLSIDTEGSEYDILSAFPFERYRFRAITCEHNFTPARERIRQLLESKGYRRVFERASRFDDWYVQATGSPAASVS